MRLRREKVQLLRECPILELLAPNVSLARAEAELSADQTVWDTQRAIVSEGKRLQPFTETSALTFLRDYIELQKIARMAFASSTAVDEEEIGNWTYSDLRRVVRCLIEHGILPESGESAIDYFREQIHECLGRRNSTA